MTPEQYKAMQMEHLGKMDAAPLANQVFKPVKVTQVPTPPNYRAQEPQIIPQQRQPDIGQQFGRAMTKKAVTAGVDAVTGLPVFSTLFAEKGTKVPKSWKKYQKMQGSMGTPYGKEKAKDWYIDKSKEQMNVAPSSSPSPSYANRGEEIPHSGEPVPRPQAIGPLGQSQDEINKWYQEMYDKPHDPDNLDDPYLDNIRDLIDPDDPMLMAQNQGVVFDLRVLPPRLRSEYIQRLKSGMGHDEIIRLFESRAGKPRDYMKGTIQRYNEGGNVTYAEEGKPISTHGKGVYNTTWGPMWQKPIRTMWKNYTGGNVPLTVPWVMRRQEESLEEYRDRMNKLDAATIWNQYNRKGMTGPSQFHVPADNPQVSPSKESYWQKAERTGLFGVPGTKNVYVDPGKGTVAYQREDVKPFTWMWNKGRDFLGYGAPLAERSE